MLLLFLPTLLLLYIILIHLFNLVLITFFFFYPLVKTNRLFVYHITAKSYLNM